MQKIQQKILNVKKAENAKNASPHTVHHHLQCITSFGASPPTVHHHLRCITTFSTSLLQLFGLRYYSHKTHQQKVLLDTFAILTHLYCGAKFCNGYDPERVVPA